MANLEAKSFESPDEVRPFTDKGEAKIVKLSSGTVGLATFEPGWRWSEHVGAALGQTSWQIEHVCLVLSGRDRITMDDGRAVDVGPGDLFTVPPGHDSEVLGDEPYVSLHLMGGDAYAR